MAARLCPHTQNQDSFLTIPRLLSRNTRKNSGPSQLHTDAESPTTGEIASKSPPPDQSPPQAGWGSSGRSIHKPATREPSRRHRLLRRSRRKQKSAFFSASYHHSLIDGNCCPRRIIGTTIRYDSSGGTKFRVPISCALSKLEKAVRFFGVCGYC